jgi:hypothetical protein
LKLTPDFALNCRAVLLGDELINLPELVAENTRSIAENSRLIKELIASQETIIGRLGHVEADVADLKEDNKIIKADVADLKTDVADLKGSRLESSWRNWGGKFRRIDIVRSVFDPMSNNDLFNLIIEAEEGGSITKDEGKDLESIDIIFPVVFKDKSKGYLVVEVSVNIEKNGFARAIKRAKVLSKMTQEKCIPVAVGKNVKSPPPEGLYVLTDKKL